MNIEKPNLQFNVINNSHTNRLACHRRVIAPKSFTMLYEKKKSQLHHVLYSFDQEDRAVNDCTRTIISSASCFPASQPKLTLPVPESILCLMLQCLGQGTTPALPLKALGPFAFALAQALTSTQFLLHLTDLQFPGLLQICQMLFLKGGSGSFWTEGRRPAPPLLKQTAYEDNTSLAVQRETTEWEGQVVRRMQDQHHKYCSVFCGY